MEAGRLAGLRRWARHALVALTVLLIGLVFLLIWRWAARNGANGGDLFGVFSGAIGAGLALAGSMWLMHYQERTKRQAERHAFSVLIRNLERAVVISMLSDTEIARVDPGFPAAESRARNAKDIPAHLFLLRRTEIGLDNRDWKMMASITRLTRELEQREEALWKHAGILTSDPNNETARRYFVQNGPELLDAVMQLLIAVGETPVGLSTFVEEQALYDSEERRGWRDALSRARSRNRLQPADTEVGA